MRVTDSRTRVNSTPSGSAGPQDELFDVLRHSVRRWILLELVYANPSDVFTVDDFVTGTTGLDQEKLALYHVHLPKLASAGYIGWEYDEGAFARGPEFETIVSAIELLTSYSDRLPGGWI